MKFSIPQYTNLLRGRRKKTFFFLQLHKERCSLFSVADKKWTRPKQEIKYIFFIKIKGIYRGKELENKNLPCNSTKSIFFLSFAFIFSPDISWPFSQCFTTKKDAPSQERDISELPNFTLKPRIFSFCFLFLSSPLSPSILREAKVHCFAAFLVHKVPQTIFFQASDHVPFPFIEHAKSYRGGKSELLKFCLVFTPAYETECENEHTSPQRVHRLGGFVQKRRER